METVISDNGEKLKESAAGFIPFTNPATGEQFGQVQMSTPEEVYLARREMAAVAPFWAAKPVKERAKLLRKVLEVIVDSMDEITATVTMDNGKSRHQAGVEMFTATLKLHEYLRHAPKWLSRTRIPRGFYFFRKYYVDYVPYGVVAIIGPWNYPFELIVPATFSALLAGNTVLVKPSEISPATGALIERLFSRVPEVAPFVRFLHGDAAIGEALVNADPDMIFLTGSVRTGQIVAKKAAETMTPFFCELGGKDPLIILEDADIEAAAKWAVWGGISFNTGQSCIAVERVYVVAEVYDQFLDAVIEEVKKVKIGFSPDTDSPYQMGPLTFDRQCQIVNDHLADAQEKGARIVYGGKQDGMFMEPTIVVDVDHTMKIMVQETFGPVMPIMKVADETHAVQLANHSEFGLSAYVWSNNIPRAKRVAEQLEVGVVLINDILYHYLVAQLPFGGMKKSGNARTHGKAELMQFTQRRSYAVGKPPYPFDIMTILRDPGSYQLLKTTLHLVNGVTPQQKVKPIREIIERSEVTPKVGKAAVATGALAAAATIGLTLLKVKKSK